MKSAFGKYLVAVAIMSASVSVHAAAAVADLTCKGKGIVANISYIVAITDTPQVSLKVMQNARLILDVATEGDEGKSVNLIHNAYTTKTDVDQDGNILHYGGGVAPTQLAAFINNGGSQPQLLAIDLEKRTLTYRNKTATISCENN